MNMYIRTKDGIMKIDDYLEECEKWQDVKHLTTKEKFLQGTQQSSNLAELCDAYVFVSKSGETHYIYGFDYDMGVKISGSRIESDEAFKNHLLENGNIYGCIWTDKGLIYVVKLNDNGDLELI